jgi:hypothetical protein
MRNTPYEVLYHYRERLSRIGATTTTQLLWWVHSLSFKSSPRFDLDWIVGQDTIQIRVHTHTHGIGSISDKLSLFRDGEKFKALEILKTRYYGATFLFMAQLPVTNL